MIECKQLVFCLGNTRQRASFWIRGVCEREWVRKPEREGETKMGDTTSCRGTLKIWDTKLVVVFGRHRGLLRRNTLRGDHHRWFCWLILISWSQRFSFNWRVRPKSPHNMPYINTHTIWYTSLNQDKKKSRVCLVSSTIIALPKMLSNVFLDKMQH